MPQSSYGDTVCRMPKLTVEIGEELLRRFRLAAVKGDMTMSEVVRVLVDAFVKREEGRSGP